MKRERGITLIALVITIIVLMILAGVAVSLLSGDKSVIQGAQDAGNKYDSGATEEQGKIEQALNKLSNAMVARDGSWNEEQQVNSPLLMDGMVAVYWSTDGGKTVSTTQENAEPIYSKIVTIDGEEKPSSTGGDNTNFNWNNWYNYVAGDNSTDTKQSRWANAVTDDGSYWVWIPRFKYKIDYTGVGNTPGNDVAGTIDVKFIKTSEQSGATGYTTSKIGFPESNPTTYEFITKDANEYIVHPAFENGSTTSNKAKTAGWADTYAFNNGEWDAELPGFWVAKYEMSMANANGAHIETTEENGNVALGASVKMLSVHNVSSWRYITVGQAYTNCLVYDGNKNSHMMKSSEWGAVAYLTHSQYGRNGNEITINNNSAFITGIAGSSPIDTTTTTETTNSYNTTAGMKASTTGNIYGVYDMSGGAYEHVTTYNNKATSLINGSSFVSSNGLSTKYATAYSNGTNTYYGETVWNVCRIGDAIKETYVSEDGNRGYSWFNDYSHFVRLANPFMYPGGIYYHGVGAGIFSANNAKGDAEYNRSFRAVLCNEVY